MKQDFNVGVAQKFGVFAAIIVCEMIAFCKCADKCTAFMEGGRLYVTRSLLYDSVFDYMPKFQFTRGLNVLINHGIIERSNNKDAYTFTDYAKGLFSKAPIRIIITWQ